MKIRLLVVLIVGLSFCGCSGKQEISIGENLSAQEQKIAFREVLDGPYKDGDYEKAFAGFEKIAAQGNDDAAFFVALSYSKGRGVKQDTEKGLQMLKVLAEKGHYSARDTLARELKSRSFGSEGGNEEWLEVTSKNAETGDRRAWEALAEYYQKIGDVKNYFKYSLGLARFFNSSQAKSVVAQAFLSDNAGTEKDLAEAIYWLYRQEPLLNASATLEAAAPDDRLIINFIITQKLAAERLPDKTEKPLPIPAVAQNHLVLELSPQEICFALTATANEQHDAVALLKRFLEMSYQKRKQELMKNKDAKGLYELAQESYQPDSNIFGNRQHNLDTLEIAAEMGNTDAMLMLGNVYCSNPKNPDLIKSGLDFYLRAAAANDGRAYARLAELFENMANFTAPVAESLEQPISVILEKGILADDPKAMLGMARLLLYKSVEENLTRAVGLLKNSSARGDLDASYELAKVYLNKSRPVQRQSAIDLLEKAAEKGHLASLELLFNESNSDCSRYKFEKIEEWLKNVSKNDMGRAHIFLMRHYFDAGKYKDAYRWFAASHLDELTIPQEEQKKALKEKISKQLSHTELQVLFTGAISNRDELEKARRLKQIEDSIRTETGLLMALLRYDFFKDHSDFQAYVEYRPVLARLQQLATKDPELYGFFLGAVYSRSFSPYYDIDAAIKAFQISAERGNPYSMLRLAQIYQRRAKKLLDSPEADALFAQAASLGIEEAKIQLGYQQLNRGNFSQTLDILAEPARNGNIWAMFALAGLYEQGLGTKQDLYQATALYQQAAKHYLALYPFYERARTEWAKNPQAESAGEFILEDIDPAQAAAESMARLDTFLNSILKD